VLLGGQAGQRLEPVRVVRGAVLEGPVLHGGGDGVGQGGVERLAVLERALQALVDVLGQALTLLGGAEDVGAEDLVLGGGQVDRPERATVRVPLRGGDVLLTESCRWHATTLGAGTREGLVHVAKPTGARFALMAGPFDHVESRVADLSTQGR
jgi:hypothetical protein